MKRRSRAQALAIAFGRAGPVSRAVHPVEPFDTVQMPMSVKANRKGLRLLTLLVLGTFAALAIYWIARDRIPASDQSGSVGRAAASSQSPTSSAASPSSSVGDRSAVSSASESARQSLAEGTLKGGSPSSTSGKPSSGSPTEGAAAELRAHASPSTDGVSAAAAIDWDAIGGTSPISPSMPTRRGAIDAIDAGFSPEWFERSLGDATLYSLRDHGRDYPSRILPLAMSIMSESRQPDDAWANGVEAQWNALVDKYSPQDPTLISRTYCNAHGCLLYTDTEQPTRAADGKVLVDFLDGKPSPAQQFGIAPRNVFRAGNFLWFLTVIERPK